jgi:hypothetical protein
MALYRYGQYLQMSTDDAFNARHSPGTAAPHPGIYRCIACGDEIGIAGGHTLPRRITRNIRPTPTSNGNCSYTRNKNEDQDAPLISLTPTFNSRRNSVRSVVPSA